VLVLFPLPLRQDSLSSTLTIAGPAEPGTRLTMSGVVRDARGQPIGGATLHVYQADATGRYTPARPMDEPHARLNGRLRADTAGRFEIRTVRPGSYPMTVHVGGRDRHIPAHIHVDVNVPDRPERRFQLVFADDSLLHDPYWIAWARTLREPVVAVRRTAAGDSATVVLTLD
jgi:protocatechuate 3,4-dioxygenase beta subunit